MIDHQPPPSAEPNNAAPSRLPIEADGLSVETFRAAINRGLVEQDYGATWRPEGAPDPHVGEGARLGLHGVERALETWDELHANVPESQRPPAPRWIDARSALVRVVSSVTPPQDGFQPGKYEGDPPVKVTDGWRQAGEPRGETPSISLSWRPQVEPSGHERRRRLHEVKRGIACIQRITSRDGQWSRMASCGHAIAHGRARVGVMVTPSTGRARYSGLQTCGSVWECPTCAAAIQASRADEITRAVDDHWGLERAVLLTLTVRHAPTSDLKALRRGLADAWRIMRSGAPWRRIAERWGIKGYIKALEVTHGPNGWHPHLHVIFLLDRPIAATRWRTTKNGQRYMTGELRRPEGGEGPPEPWDRAAALWRARWQHAVTKAMGEEYVPDDRRGLFLTPCERSTYLAKFGLELAGIGKADPSTKKSWRRRHGYRAPFEIAADFADHQNLEDAELWRAWCEGIHGARHLTWSRGLKAAAGITERTDEELATEEDPGGADQVLVGHIEAADWRRLRKVHVRPDAQSKPWRRVLATLWILDQVEDQGARALPGLIAWALEHGRAYPPGAVPTARGPDG